VILSTNPSWGGADQPAAQHSVADGHDTDVTFPVPVMERTAGGEVDAGDAAEAADTGDGVTAATAATSTAPRNL
jgi:hypothetical protein